MAQVELTSKDIDALRDILQNTLSELRWEIAFTHKKDIVKFLQNRREFIEDFIQRLQKVKESETGKA
jgi:RNAse (barnase) inhibitor barstar